MRYNKIMNNELQIGNKVKFNHNGTVLNGIVDRIVKMSGPCQPTDDINKWSYHVVVQSDNMRHAGIYQLNLKDIEVY